MTRLKCELTWISPASFNPEKKPDGECLNLFSRYSPPVPAGIVRSPEKYPWSSYRYYIGKKKPPDWLSTEWLTDKCGKRLKTRQRKYREYVEAGIESRAEYPAEKIVGQAILGSKEFVRKVLNQPAIHGEGKERAYKERSKGQMFLDMHCNT